MVSLPRKKNNSVRKLNTSVKKKKNILHIRDFKSILYTSNKPKIGEHMAIRVDEKVKIFNALVEKEIPIHPIKKRSKAPMFNSWPIESNKYKVAASKDGVLITQTGRLGNVETKIDSDFEIGAKAGASIGEAHDNYLCFLDIDLPDSLDRDITGRIKNTDTAEVAKKELDRLIDEFCRVSKIPKSKVVLERSGGDHRGFHLPFISPLPLLSNNKAMIFSDHKYLTEFDIYAYNKKFEVKNIVISPSIGRYEYAVYNHGKKAKSVDDFIEYYRSIPRISFSGWYNLTLLYKEEDIARNQFALLNRALLPSMGINYELFGGIYSGMAAYAGMPKDVYKDMFEHTFVQHPNPKKDTMENIPKYIDATYEKMEKKKLNPRGIPALKDHIKDIWKSNRKIEDSKTLKEELDIFCHLISSILSYKKETKRQEKFDKLISKGYVCKSDLVYDRYTREPSPEEVDSNLIASVVEDFNSQGSKIKVNKRLINGFCDAGNIIIYGASPGTGKSVSLIDGMYSASKGELVWDNFVVDNPLKVLYAYADKDSADFKSKYVDRYSNDIKSNDNFKILYADSFRSSGLKPDLADPMTRVAFKEICGGFKPDLLVFDTFKTWFPTFNENDTVESNSIYEIFLKFTRDFHCAAFLITHTPKSKADNYSSTMYHAAKGAGALVDRATTVAYITPQHDERQKPIKNKNFVSFPKTGVNIIPPFKFEIINKENYNLQDNASAGTWGVEYEESTEEEYISDQTESKKHLRELKVLRSLKDGPKRMSELATTLGVPSEMKYRNAVYVVQEIENKKLIVKEGARRSAKYKITAAGEYYIKGKIEEYIEEQERIQEEEWIAECYFEEVDGIEILHLPPRPEYIVKKEQEYIEQYKKEHEGELK